MKKLTDQILDFAYVIIQRRLSSARYLIKTGFLLLMISSPSLVLKINKGDYSLLIDTASTPISDIVFLIICYVGIASILTGITFEIKERYLGEAAKINRSKSIDLRSLDGAAAPTLADTYSNIIETTGLHQDLFLLREREQDLDQWLDSSTRALLNFSDNILRRLNSYEPQKPLALGAIAHVPHCFVLGFLVGNKRLANFYCWQRDSKKKSNNRWIDCRDIRTKGQQLISTLIENKKNGSNNRAGISIEISMENDIDNFMRHLNLDIALKLEVKNKYIGNMFSEREQVNIICEIRNRINDLINENRNINELHITITGQCSFVMRLGSDFNQNHLNMPIYIYHYEKNAYPWAFIINKPKKFDISFTSNSGL